MLGRVVRAGELLIELDSEPQRLRLREEEARLRAMPAKAASLRSEIATIEQAIASDQHASQAAVQVAQARVREAAATADFANETERRIRDSGAGSVAEIDALKAIAEARRQTSASAALAADVHRLEFDAQTRTRESQARIEALRRSLLSLEAEAEAVRASIAMLTLEIERHRVRAPIDGTIGEVMAISSGAFVAEGQRLATIVPDGKLLIVADFDPASALGRIRPGQTARLRLDGFPWAQYGAVEATVARVGGEIRDDLIRVELAPVAGAMASMTMQHGLTGVVEVGVEDATPASLLLRASGQRLARPAASSVAIVAKQP
jgi:membrane fusion protein (multidrug efflux system)